MINMDGRMYDPYIGRFLSPDPYVQAPDFTQSLNRYAYCINNPLSLTDPSGYNWIGDTFCAFVGIAVGLETGGIGAGVWGAVIGGACGGASSALANCMINGANLWQTTKSTLIGGFWGAASGAINFGIGEISNGFWDNIALHSIADGSMEALHGGHFEHGLLVGMVSTASNSGLMKYGSNLSYAQQIAASAIIGGTVSALGGGKFANGAMTAAFQMLYNDQMHIRLWDRDIKDIYTKYITENVDQDCDLIPAATMCKKIGGELTKVADGIENSCALRLSIALNGTKFKIPSNAIGAKRGANGRYYIISAEKMGKYLQRYTTCARKINPGAIKNGLVFQHPDEAWRSQSITGHVDVVYRGSWGSSVLGGHGGDWQYNKPTDVFH